MLLAEQGKLSIQLAHDVQRRGREAGHGEQLRRLRHVVAERPANSGHQLRRCSQHLLLARCPALGVRDHLSGHGVSRLKRYRKAAAQVIDPNRCIDQDHLTTGRLRGMRFNARSLPPRRASLRALSRSVHWFPSRAISHPQRKRQRRADKTRGEPRPRAARNRVLCCATFLRETTSQTYLRSRQRRRRQAPRTTTPG